MKPAAAPLLALLALAAGAPGTAHPASAVVVHRIEIEGTRRTAPAHVERLLGVAPGQAFDPTDVARLEQRLVASRLFTSVHVDPLPDGAGGVALRVRVEERRTRIVLPVLAAGRGSVGAGAVLRDANLLGGGEQLTLAATLSDRGSAVLAAYRDPGVAGSRWLLATEVARQDLVRRRYDGTDVAHALGELRLDLDARVGLHLGDHVAVSAGWFALWVEGRAAEGYPPPPPTAPVHGPSVELTLRSHAYRLYYAPGLAATLRYRESATWMGSGRALRQGSATATYARAGFRDHALSLTVDLQRSHGEPVLDAVRLGGRPGARGLVTGGLWAEDAALAAVEYQVPIWRPRWGIATAVGFCDAGVVRWEGTTTRYVAPGLGVRLHLRGIALPALGVDVAWASPMAAPLASVSAGFRL